MTKVEAVEFTRMFPEAIVPYQTYRGDAGFDIASYKDYILEPFKITDMSIGICIKMPSNMYARITNRSSTPRKWNLYVTEGIIDPSYIGELFVGVRNDRGVPVKVPAETRLAQLIFSPVMTPDFIEVEALTSTERGKRGFGSTGR